MFASAPGARGRPYPVGGIPLNHVLPKDVSVMSEENSAILSNRLDEYARRILELNKLCSICNDRSLTPKRRFSGTFFGQVYKFNILK